MRSGISLQHRKGVARAVKDFEVWVKGDSGDFVKIGKFSTLNQEGRQTFNFASPQTFRYIKIVMLNAFDGLQFASLGELELY